MDSVVIENIPYEAIAIMSSLFEKGNTVNSYRIIGNTHGFTITFQMCLPKEAKPGIQEYSPLATPKSKKHYKSPSALLRDKIRIDSFVLDHKSTPSLRDQQEEADTSHDKDVHCDVTNEISVQSDKQELGDDMIEQDTQTDDGTTAVSDELEQEQDVRDDEACESEVVIDVRDKAEKKNDGDCINDKTPCDSERDKRQGDAAELSVDNTAPTDKIEDKEQLYKQNIQSKSRNLEYHKILHDTRNEGSLVYGVTDDLVVSVDEINCKFTSWAKHDKDKRCEEILQLAERWPEANTKRCKYGIDSLHAVLPDIVLHEQKSAAK